MRILVLSLFPSEEPRHGGQIRLNNIIKKYKSLGHEVASAGVLGSESYPRSPYFIEYPKVELRDEIPAMTDFAIGELLVNDQALSSKLINLFPWVPDVIHVELPWLFKFAEKYVSLQRKRIPIIYGSENVECILKEAILSSVYNNSYAREKVSLVRDVEINACKNADSCLAVSTHDLEWMKEKANKSIYLAPNGVSPFEVTKKGEAEFQKLSLPNKFVLFCASAHLPNILGLYEMFKPALACIDPSQKLVIVGGCGGLINSDPRFREIPLFDKRTLLLGEVSEDLKCSLLAKAHCIILPITSGGGTNLKTAEAILSGCYVVGTKIAFRGFEQFINSSGVEVVDDGVAFRNAVRTSLMKSKNDIKSEYEKKEILLWNNCLKSLEVCLNNL